MSVIEHAVDIAAPPEVVWRVYVDPVRLPEWQTGNPVIEDVTGPGDRVGTTYVSRRGPGAARTTIVESDPPGRLVTMTTAYFGLRFDVTSELRAAGPGTRLTIRAETRWPRGAGVLGRLVEAVLLSGGEARKELAALKALVERERALPR
ncbi:MAG TPA: SRPBCC family protein [Candidatus Limnocylindrales bacterium]|nr:SRPBCC family protein [Candidatus Limnocylindrales bacterium]